MSPIFLFKIYSLKLKDPKTWWFLHNNPSCCKTLKAFSAIEVDICLEQENNNLKVVGGIVGLLTSTCTHSVPVLTISQIGIIKATEEKISLTIIQLLDM